MCVLVCVCVRARVQAVAAFERTLRCETLPEAEKENVSQALAHAQYRLREGRDAVEMPDMSHCAIC